MDQTGAAIVEAVSPYGLVPLLVVGAGVAVVAILCVFVLPTWRKNLEAQQDIERMKAEAQIALEREREDRKAKEADAQARREIERAQLDTQNAVLLEGLKTSIDALVSNQERTNALLEGSRGGSQKMGSTVEDTNRKVTEIHHALIN